MLRHSCDIAATHLPLPRAAGVRDHDLLFSAPLPPLFACPPRAFLAPSLPVAPCAIRMCRMPLCCALPSTLLPAHAHAPAHETTPLARGCAPHCAAWLPTTRCITGRRTPARHTCMVSLHGLCLQFVCAACLPARSAVLVSLPVVSMRFGSSLHTVYANIYAKHYIQYNMCWYMRVNAILYLLTRIVAYASTTFGSALKFEAACSVGRGNRQNEVEKEKPHTAKVAL
jgi:hypothetical protein